VGPYLLGLVRDVTGSYQYSFWFIGLFFAFVTLLPVILLRQQIKGIRAAKLNNSTENI
jgi:cyanate permease